MRLTVLFLFLLCANGIQAQYLQRSSMGMSGSTASVEVGDAVLYYSSSVGQQGVIGTIGYDNFRMRQGFQQPPLRVLGSVESEENLKVVVFPNPTRALLTVSLGSQSENPIQVLVYDLLGRTVIQQEFSPAASFDLNLSELASGAYVLRVVVGTQSFATRIVKY